MLYHTAPWLAHRIFQVQHGRELALGEDNFRDNRRGLVNRNPRQLLSPNQSATDYPSKFDGAIRLTPCS
jgi:hypothetical protein